MNEKINQDDLQIRLWTSSAVKDIYKIQKCCIDYFKEKSHLKIVNDEEIYGTFLDDKMLAWIFLTISYRIRK